MTAGGPIFIGGLDRSGKTALRMALEARFDLVLVRRMELWTTVYGRFGDLARDRNARACLEAVRRRPHIADQIVHPDELAVAFLSGPRTYGALFAEIGRQICERASAPRWGEQEALLERYAAPIFNAFPDAFIIQMVRDPRDRCAALAQSGTRRGGIATAITAWADAVAIAEANRRIYPERCLVVRYEDLLADPDAVLRDLSEKMGLALLPGAVGTGPAAAGAREAAAGTSHRRPLRPREVALVQARLGRQMRTLRYRDERISLGSMERIRLVAVDLPMYAVTSTAWRLRQRASGGPVSVARPPAAPVSASPS